MAYNTYDLGLFAIFCIAIILFIIFERKKMVREGLMYLYKTSIGLKLMDRIAKKYPKTLRFLSYVIVFVGFILLFLSIYFLIDIIKVFMNPLYVKIIKIPPIMPLIPYLPELFKISWLPSLPFSNFILALALVAIFHEGFHGIFARFYKIKIKSSGFGFLGPFLAFFVEQDEESMKKAKPFSQMTVLAAGVFANILLAILFLIIMLLFTAVAYTPAGVIYGDYAASMVPYSEIAIAPIIGHISIDGANVSVINIQNVSYLLPSNIALNTNLGPDTLAKLYLAAPAIEAGLNGAISKINGNKITSQEVLARELSNYRPGEIVNITTIFKNDSKITSLNYQIKLSSNPLNSSKSFLGIASYQTSSTTKIKEFLYKLTNFFKDPSVFYEPKTNPELMSFIYNLLFWLFMINFGVALANMWPVAIFDGGYFFYLIVFSLTKNKNIAEKALKISTTLFLASLVLVMFFWAKALFFTA
jgi:membrane-associated protease RseP (regulator of RpoE activity)